MNEVHYESYQEKDKMLLKVLDENGNITDIEATKKKFMKNIYGIKRLQYLLLIMKEKYCYKKEVRMFIIITTNGEW